MTVTTAQAGTPLVVGIGGTLRPGSTSETALRVALRAIERRGIRTLAFAGPQLELPFFSPQADARPEPARAIIEALREADSVVLSSPGYHGSVSGLIKNVLDYVEDMRADPEPYLDGRAVGCIVSAAGWQATSTTLSALRDIVHALRGWPTPLGVCLSSATPLFDASGGCIAEGTATQIDIMADQVAGFARYRRSLRAARLAAG